VNEFTRPPIVPPPLQPVPPVPVPPPLPASLEFTGNRKGFLHLVTRGAALELVTLGFYRFWLVTDIRRQLWANTVIDGDAAEYTGRGRELLIGFLIALAILVPIYLLYFLISVEVEHLRALASIPLVASFFVFGQFAIYRARRYRLTRTVWRGVRLWMDGSGWIYAWWSSVWLLLVIVTLGLALPWRAAALERYKMQHSWYGDLQGDFVGSGWVFFKQIWWLWLVTPLALFASPALPFLYGHYKAVEWRWWVSGIRFGGVTAESKLESDALIDLYWKMIGWYFLLIIGFAIVIGGAAALSAGLGGISTEELAAPGGITRAVPLLVVTVISYLALALALSVVVRLYLTRDVWARVLSTTVVTNLDAAANVTATGDLATAVGEGIADGLDVAGF
jgi:uncharacterized membrane protein YjgN (DUF898 family)